MLRSLKYSALVLGLMGATQAMAGPDLTVVSFGGANKAAQVKAEIAKMPKTSLEDGIARMTAAVRKMAQFRFKKK